MNKFLAVLVCLGLFTGCKRPLNYNYAFDVNGTTERGNTYTAIYQFDTAAALKEFAADFYIGSPVDTNYVQVSFSSNNYIMPGTYYTGITNAENTVCSFAYNNKHTYYSNVTGILQITRIDTVLHNLKGSFQFKAVNTTNYADTVNVTDGGFSGINYVTQ